MISVATAPWTGGLGLPPLAAAAITIVVIAIAWTIGWVVWRKR